MPDTNNEQGVTPDTQTVTPPVMNQVPPPNESAEQKYQRLYSGGPSTPDVATTLAALTAELASMKSQMASRPASQVTPASASAEAPWVTAIREGKFSDAESAMAAAIEAKLAPRLDQVRQDAYQQAASAAQITQSVNQIVQEVRHANPDLAAFEDYLQAPVNQRVQLARDAGRIQNPQDFLREYRAALDGEVTKLRNVSQQFRAAGKDDALTRVSDVNRSTPLTPQQVQNQSQTQTIQQANQQGESQDDYFSRRRAAEQRNHGMS